MREGRGHVGVKTTTDAADDLFSGLQPENEDGNNRRRGRKADRSLRLGRCRFRLGACLMCQTVLPSRFDPPGVERTKTRVFGMGFRNFRGSRFNGVLVFIESACPRRVRLEVADKAAGTESPLL
jgi:hypothetical protein